MIAVEPPGPEEVIRARLARSLSVLSMPGARVICSEDLWEPMLRMIQPGHAGCTVLPPGVSLCLDPALSKRTLVALAPVRAEGR